MLKKKITGYTFTKFNVVTSLCRLFYYASTIKSSSSFDYRDFNSWIEISPLCGYGKCQSPIDLDPRSKIVHGLPLDFKNYAGELPNATIWNAGHTVKIVGDWGNSTPSVTGTLVKNAQYLLYETHLHWSNKDDSGTDHSINGKRYASELHLVHYNSKYANPKEAKNKDDGILVVGKLYKVKKESPSPDLKAVANLMAAVRKENSTSTGILNLSLFKLGEIKSFYTYAGSLTSPPCSENVLWLVADRLFPVNADVMKVIRSVKLSDADTSNVRPIQPPNGREVILYKK